MIHTGGMTRVSASPTSTARAAEATSASADPEKTTQRDDPPLASDKVASCVLSPSSATKIEANVVASSFQSIRQRYAAAGNGAVSPLGGPTP